MSVLEIPRARKMVGSAQHPTKVMPIAATFIGVDVGSPRKGFHAIALRGREYLDQFHSTDPMRVASWCRDLDAKAVGVDAPCARSEDGRARPAERELMQEKIWCFSSPGRDVALAHAKGHFNWMLNGEALFQALIPLYPLFEGGDRQPDDNFCFETFPHAIASALAGGVVSAKKKVPYGATC